MRHVRIGRYLKVTLAYRGLMCQSSDNLVLGNISTAATYSGWTLPESSTGLQILKC